MPQGLRINCGGIYNKKGGPFYLGTVWALGFDL